ncbi:MAG: peptide chain release factor N(5)-glutamine methyltransferase [Elusimicrobiota bacterium]
MNMLKNNYTAEELFCFGCEKLRSENIICGETDCKFLLSDVLGFSITDLFINLDLFISESQAEKFKYYLDKRINRIPIQYIIGKAWFMGLEFFVNKDVFIPRPETEIMVEKCLEYLDNKKSKRVIEIGTGCGNIAISIAKFCNARVKAVDKSKKALKIAQRNSNRLGVKNMVDFANGDIFSVFNEREFRSYDMLISNPPYVSENDYTKASPEVKKEPKISLVGGKHGLEYIKKILNYGPKFIKQQGKIFLEIGYNQKDKVCDVLEKCVSIKDYEFIKDYNKIDRILKATVK